MKSSKNPWFMVDPFEIAIFLTLIVLSLASLLTEYSLGENLQFWGQGLWGLIGFMTQMSLILMGGYVLAISKPVRKLLGGLASLPQTQNQSYLLCFFVSALACWCNWGLGLVTGAFFAIELYSKNNKLHFPLLVAISYMGFIFWHAGLSGSIPLTVGTPGNFSEKWLGEVLPLSKTLFSFFNLGLIFVLWCSLAGLILYFSKNIKTTNKYKNLINTDVKFGTEKPNPFSQAMLWVLVILMLFFIGQKISLGLFSLGLNEVILLLFLLSILVYRDLNAYVKAATEACSKLAPILIQYPLYAGIMAIMIKSGLAVKISDAFVSFSSEVTYPVYMFLSAGLVNFFVPSGGGQWAVQAAVVVEGAKQLNVPLEKAVMAVAWGDAWTNLAQPFWALPLLSIVGLGLKDIMLYCLSALLVSGSVISLWFIIF